MTLSIRTLAIDTFIPVLRSLSGLLDKGAAYAAEKKFDPAVLVGSRLAPDMFPLSMQVQIACDQAKNNVARLAGQEPPKFEDNEKTIDELKARIAKTIAYIEGTPAAGFEGAEERPIVIPLQAGMELAVNGLQLLRDWTLPNFYFHVVTAYDILRHNGVPIGKPDFLSHVGQYMRQRPA